MIKMSSKKTPLARNDMENNIRTCLTAEERAIKPRDIRLVVLNCFQLENGPLKFWQKLVSLPLAINTKNHIVMWKLCQLIHNVLNKGPATCIIYGQKYWSSHLISIVHFYNNSNGSALQMDGYNVCIVKYIKLITTKIQFYLKYKTVIPPDLQIKDQNWQESFDVIKLLNLAIDIFDYLDDILVLQQFIYSTKLTYGIAPILECRFMALPILIDESKILYFSLIKIMNTLHLYLTKEILDEYCQRFKQLFYNIKAFYDDSIEINLFKKILWIPKMTDEPPSFQGTVTENILSKEEIRIRLKEIQTASNQQVQQEPNITHVLERQPEYNPNVKEAQDNYYDSDFSSSEDEDAENNVDEIVEAKNESNYRTYNRQDTLVGPSPPTAPPMNQGWSAVEGSAPPLELILEDKDKTIKNLKKKLTFSEQTMALRNIEMVNLRKENSNLNMEVSKLKQEISELKQTLFKTRQENLTWKTEIVKVSQQFNEQNLALLRAKQCDLKPDPIKQHSLPQTEQRQSNCNTDRGTVGTANRSFFIDVRDHTPIKNNLWQSKTMEFRSQYNLNSNFGNDSTSLHPSLRAGSINTINSTAVPMTKNFTKSSVNHTTLVGNKFQLKDTKPTAAKPYASTTDLSFWPERDFALYNFDELNRFSSTQQMSQPAIRQNPVMSLKPVMSPKPMMRPKPAIRQKPVSVRLTLPNDIRTYTPYAANTASTIKYQTLQNPSASKNIVENESIDFQKAKSFWHKNKLIG